MSSQDFLAVWLPIFAVILACRVVPIFALRGRELPNSAVEALGYIPPAAFAAGPWPALLPIVAAIAVAVVAQKTRSMLWSCVAGVVAYVALTLI